MQSVLTGRTVLVTGGAGFVGSHLVERLVSDNEVRVVDDLSTGRRDRVPDDAELIVGSVADEEPLRRAFDGGVDVVFHAAAWSSVGRSVTDPTGSHRVNSSAGLRVLERAREADARVVLSSSAAIYGPPEDVPVPETAPKRPTSPYGVQKLSLDHYARLYHEIYGVETVSLRYFNVFGPRDGASVVDAFVRQAREGEALTVHGDGSQTRDFVHVDDVVRANLLAATTDRVGEAYNVGTGRSTSVAELARAVLDVTDADADVIHEPPRDADIEHSRADVSKARRRLGFEADVSLRDGLRSLCSAPEIV